MFLYEIVVGLEIPRKILSSLLRLKTLYNFVHLAESPVIPFRFVIIAAVFPQTYIPLVRVSIRVSPELVGYCLVVCKSTIRNYGLCITIDRLFCLSE